MNTLPQINDKEVQKEMLALLGIENLPEDAQKEVLAAAGGPISQSVTLALLEKLPETEREAFISASEKGKSDEVERIITEHIPNIDAFISAEVRKAAAEFKKLYEDAVGT